MKILNAVAFASTIVAIVVGVLGVVSSLQLNNRQAAAWAFGFVLASISNFCGQLGKYL